MDGFSDAPLELVFSAVTERADNLAFALMGVHELLRRRRARSRLAHDMFVLPFHRLLSASAFTATAFPHVAGTAVPADDFDFLSAAPHGYFFPRFRRPLRPPLWLMRFPRSIISMFFPIMVCSFL